MNRCGRTLSFLEKSYIKPYPKRVISIFSQQPRTIRGSSNHSFASTELTLDYIPEPFKNCMTSFLLHTVDCKAITVDCTVQTVQNIDLNKLLFLILLSICLICISHFLC